MGGKKHTQSSTADRIAAINIQTSAYGNCVPIVIGRNRVTAQLIYYTDFYSVGTTTDSSTGKGGSSSSSSTSYTYYASIAMALCDSTIAHEAPYPSSLNGVYQGWQDRTNLPLATIEADGWAIFDGSIPQTPWSYTTSHHPSEAMPYSGIAYAAHANHMLDASAGVQNHSFEVQGGYANFAYIGTGICDANPMDAVTGFLTDALYGANFPGFDSSKDTWQDGGSSGTAGQYWAANGIFIAPVWDTQQPAQQHMTDLMSTLNAEFVWAENFLRVIPYGDTAITATPGSSSFAFDPSSILSPVYALGPSDFLQQDKASSQGKGSPKDPIQVTRTAYTEPPNCVRLEFLDRSNQYSPAIAEARDATDISLYGLRVSSTVQAHHIVDMTTAKKLAQLILQRGLFIRNTYEFMLDWRFCLLEPMDVVTITEPGLGLNAYPVRVKELTESASGALSVKAEDIPLYIGTALTYGTQETSGFIPNNGVDPGDVNPPVIFRPPTTATGGVRQLWIVGSGGVDWGGANVWAGLDGVNYSQLGFLHRGIHGTLTADLAAAPAGDDVTNTLSIDVSASEGTLASFSHDDMESLLSLCYVDGELLSYENQSLSGPGLYALSPLVRGAYGSPSGLHASTSAFARLDSAVLKLNIPATYNGKTIHLKFQSVNVFGSAPQDLSSVTDYTFAIDAAGGVRMITATTSAAFGSVEVEDSVVLIDAGASSYTIQLLGASIGVLTSAQKYTIRNTTTVAGSTNVVTITPPSGGAIDSHASISLPLGSGVTVQFDGTNYNVISSTGPAYTATGFGDDFGGNFGGGF